MKSCELSLNILVRSQFSAITENDKGLDVGWFNMAV